MYILICVGQCNINVLPHAHSYNYIYKAMCLIHRHVHTHMITSYSMFSMGPWFSGA